MNHHFEVRGSQAVMAAGAGMAALAAREGGTRCRWTVLWMLGLSLVLAPQARAGLVGYYSLSNWVFTNTDNGLFPSFTNGSAVTEDGGLSVVLTGGSSGSFFPGTTDLVIQAIGTGLVQFRYAYSSKDIPSATNPGCGSLLVDPCDLGGYLLNGHFTPLADDVNQQPGTNFSFSVSTGDTFGFRVETLDNIGEPGILTISEFSAPTPEPGTTSLICLATAAMIAARVRARRPRSANSHR